MKAKGCFMPAAAAILAACCIASTSAAGQTHAAALQMLTSINAARREARANNTRIRPLRWDARLAQIALAHARDMASHHFVSHMGSRGESPLDRINQAGIQWRAMGENLAKNVSAAQAERALLNEPTSPDSHRGNILNPAYNCAGVGIVKSDDGMIYVAQEFAKEP